MAVEPKSAALRPEVQLQPQQKRVADRVAGGDDLLVYHSLGAGKSLAGIAAAEAVGGPYAFVSPASLRPNTNKELSRFSAGSSPASALSYEDVVRGKAPSGPLGTLVVDELHNLRNPASARSKAVAELASRASRKVLLTGTPIVNSPGDLAGPLSILTGRPISPAEFESRFVGREKAPRGLLATLRGVPAGYRPTLRDEKGLEALFRGKVDYHAPATPAVNEHDERIEVDMGPDQAGMHRWTWGKIPAVTRWKLQRDYPLTPAEAGNLSGFLTGPRQAAISTLPFMRGRSASPLKAFERSTKLRRAVDELEKELAANPEGKALVFSNFIDAGLSPYSAALDARKIPHGVFKGGLSDEARKRLIADYNEGKLKALLLGPSGSEGLSTRRTTLIQQLDPHWNATRGRQNKGRGIRFDSHSDLPPEERNVRVQRFISRMPRGRLARLLGREPQPTADEVLERMSAEKERLNERFRDVLRRVGTEKSAGLDLRDAAAYGLAGAATGGLLGYLGSRGYDAVATPSRDRAADAGRHRRAALWGAGIGGLVGPTIVPAIPSARGAVDAAADRVERVYDWWRAPTASMALLPNVAGAYQNAPGGVMGAAQRAIAARRPVEGMAPLTFTVDDLLTPIPIYVRDNVPRYLRGDLPSKNFRPAAGTIDNAPFGGPPRPRIDVYTGPHLTADVDLRKSISHELTHAALDNLPASRGEARQRTYEVGVDGTYRDSPAELLPRAAELKRDFVRNHPGRDVSTPADVDDALRWMRARVKEPEHANDYRYLRRSIEGSGDILPRLKAILPQVVGNFDVLRRVGSEKAAATYYHGSPRADLPELRPGSYVTPDRDTAALMGRYYTATGRTWDDSDLAEPHRLGGPARFRRGREPDGAATIYAVDADPEALDLLDNPYEHRTLRRLPVVKSAAPRNPVLADLLDAKARSDRRDFSGKHAVLRRLMADRPHEFTVDDPRGFFVGISHVPSSFRLHLPRNLVPVGVAGLEPPNPGVKAAGLADAATGAALLGGVGAAGGYAGSVVLDDVEGAARWLLRMKARPPRDHVGNAIRFGGLGAIAGGALGAASPASPGGAAKKTDPTQGKSLGGAIGRYYAKAPGGLDGAVARALARRKEIPGFGRLGFTADDVAAPVPVEVTDDVPESADGRTTFGRLVSPSIRIRPRPGDGTAEDAKHSLEHELTHAALDGRPYGRFQGDVKAERSTELRDVSTPRGRSDYFRSPSELIPRVADVKRQWVAAHPGRDVTNREEAAAALEWYKAHGRPLYRRDDQVRSWDLDGERATQSWSDWLNDVEPVPADPGLRDRILDLMPQVVSSAKPRAAKAAALAPGDFAGPAVGGAAGFLSANPLVGAAAGGVVGGLSAIPRVLAGRDRVLASEAGEKAKRRRLYAATGAGLSRGVLPGAAAGALAALLGDATRDKVAVATPLSTAATRKKKAPPGAAPAAGDAPSLARLPRAEPAPDDVLDLAVQGIKARRRKRGPFEGVPAGVVDRVKAGAAAAPEGDPFATPEALAAVIAAGVLAAAPRVDLSAIEGMGKAAAADDAATGLFTPSIPVDAFNNVVWSDAVLGVNPFGTRPASGTAEDRLSTPPQVAAAVSGLVAGAAAARDSNYVSPWDVAMAAGAAGGKGWLGGLVLGRTVGALAGLPPQAQKKLQDVGLWGGMLTGAVRSVFGGPR